MKVFCATFLHETNCLSPIPTNIESYRECCLYLPSTGEGRQFIEGDMEGLNLVRLLQERGHQVICGIAASAQPSRPTVRADYEFLRNELIANLRNAVPVDAVMLFLHGAMVAEGHDDCEGDILARVRGIVGPNIPIGVEIDLHGNVTRMMVEHADIVISCREYPHIDFYERAVDLAELLEQTVDGLIRPVTEVVRVPMLGTYFTTRLAMRQFVDDVVRLSNKDGVIVASIMHGFAWADFPEVGNAVVVVADGDRSRAREVAQKLARHYFDLRSEIAVPRLDVDTALREALSDDRGPVVIADTADNPGGGAAGDSTFLLRAVLERNISNVALAMLWDPGAVRFARMAGVGARIPLRIGGKCGKGSGDPIDVDAEVLAINEKATQWGQGARIPIGTAVAIRVDGVEIVLNTHRDQTFSPDCFTEVGIDPMKKRLLIVKSHQHFHATFAPFATKIVYAMPPGTINQNYAKAPLKRVPRPVWPIDPTPFTAYGQVWG